MFTFNHSGKMGDLLYSLYFCKAVAEASGDQKFNFNIQINVPQSLHGREEGKPRLSLEGAKFIASVIKPCPFINTLTISDTFNTKEFQNGFNLDTFRNLKLNFHCGYIADWYFNLTVSHVDRNFDQRLIDVEPNKDFEGKIIVLQTKKYLNPFVKLDPLNNYSDRLVFIGLEDEYELIKKKLPKIQYYKVNSAMDVAKAEKGALLTISNQNGNFAIAELMKTHRILIPAQFEVVGKKEKPILQNGPTNVICHGGWFDYANSTKKLEILVNDVISIVNNQDKE